MVSIHMQVSGQKLVIDLIAVLREVLESRKSKVGKGKAVSNGQKIRKNVVPNASSEPKKGTLMDAFFWSKHPLFSGLRFAVWSLCWCRRAKSRAECHPSTPRQ